MQATAAAEFGDNPLHRCDDGSEQRPIAAYRAIDARYTKDEGLIWVSMLLS